MIIYLSCPPWIGNAKHCVLWPTDRPAAAACALEWPPPFQEQARAPRPSFHLCSGVLRNVQLMFPRWQYFQVAPCIVANIKGKQGISPKWCCKSKIPLYKLALLSTQLCRIMSNRFPSKCSVPASLCGTGYTERRGNGRFWRKPIA